MSRARTAVLISGRGSNLAALIAAAQAPSYPAEISLVVSNRADAGGLDHARRRGIAAMALNLATHAGQTGLETALDDALREFRIELVCLAGFMRLLSPAFVDAWRDRLINIHPSLLPCFPGLNTHERALAAGVKIHGATVHFVRAEVDRGPIIAQAAVPVLTGDSALTLANRVLAVEHRIYPLALARVAGGNYRIVDEQVRTSGAETPAAAVLLSPPDQAD